MDIFENIGHEFLKKNAPLADRMRPLILDDFFGQEHLVGPGRLLRRAIQIDQLSSLIFYGPPGTGKTTLARIIANTTKADFISINAVLAGVKNIRDAIDKARAALGEHSRRTILFIDEVHRFNKAQQDALLPHVENGLIILIGATTENPYFEVNKALISRSRIFQLKSLTYDDLKKVAQTALYNKQKGYGNKLVSITEHALDHIIKTANGDARGVLNALELAIETTKPDKSGQIYIDKKIAEESIQKKAVLYDKDGDAHYDTISAFIKSIRGSDPDAALYWMAKMVYAGEDSRFIFRRMLILASEDVGLADPNALNVVVAAAQAFDYVGLPEGRYHLAHACLYLATAPKSNSAMAFFDALESVKNEASGEIPDHLKDANRDGDGFGHGKGYLYPHAYRDHWVAQQYLPDVLQGKVFYQPTNQGFEGKIYESVMKNRESQIESMVKENNDILVHTDSDQNEKTNNNSWLGRISNNYNHCLVQIRDRLFELAQLDRQCLFLDLNAGMGFITLEALRQAKEGTVWSLVSDEQNLSNLKSIMTKYPLLNQPMLLQADMNNFRIKIIAAESDDIRFDCIMGRNVLNQYKNRKTIIENAIGLLKSTGKIILAETVYQKGMRISEIPQLAGIDQDFRQKLQKSEDDFFSNQANPLMTFNQQRLRSVINQELVSVTNNIADDKRDNNGEKKMVSVTTDEQEYFYNRYLTKNDINGWLSADDSGNDLILGYYLKNNFSPKEVIELKNLLHIKLLRQNLKWRTVVCFITIKFVNLES